MKKVLLISLILIGCKKDTSVKPVDDTPMWAAIYNSTALINDSSKTGTGNYIYGQNVVETVNTLCIETYKDSVGLRPVYTHYGLTYFYDVLTRWVATQSYRQSYISGIINGNTVQISDTLTWMDSVRHTLIDAKLTLVSNKEVDLSYYEKINSTPIQFKHYTGRYFK